MQQVIRSFEDLTPDWLNKTLGFDGASVVSCRVTQQLDTVTTWVGRVCLDYGVAAPGKPRSIFVKLPKPDERQELKKLWAREVLFYSQIARLIPAHCIPECHAAIHEQETDDFCIVLEDLSETHFQTEYPVPPSLSWCRRALGCLAQIHAAVWNRGELEPVLGGFTTKESVGSWSAVLRKAWGEFSLFLGDRLADGRRQLIEKVMDNIDQVLGRALMTEQLTVLHRDTHLWNFFFPIAEQGEVKLFDWQLCEYGLAADDLVPMMALNWFAERRNRFEKELLKEYHAALTNAGVTKYSLETLETEYRWSVLKGIGTPLLQWHYKVPARIWFNNLEKILAAVEDLDCMDLLRRKKRKSGREQSTPRLQLGNPDGP